MDMVDDYRGGVPEAVPISDGGICLHPLEAWRICHDRDRNWMYARLDTGQSSYSKWVLPTNHKNQRVPRPEAMKRIVVLTAGVVDPNDFYPVQDWKDKAAAILRATAAKDLSREIARDAGQAEVGV